MRPATARATSTPTTEWSPARPLAMSWSSAARSSTSRRARAGDVAVETGTQRVVRVEERRALGHGLERVPVDGEAVIGVALGPCPHVLPLGQQSHEEADVVEALEHRDGPAPGGQQRHERGAGTFVPPHLR